MRKDIGLKKDIAKLTYFTVVICNQRVEWLIRKTR